MNPLEKYLDQFWQLRRSKRITNLQADLYFLLLQECRSRKWENPFQCSNILICAGITITEKSLTINRNVLKQLGLIDFDPGITKKKHPTYYLLDSCNTVSYPGGNRGGNEGGNRGAISSYSNIALVDKEIVAALKKNFLENAELAARWTAQGFGEEFEAGLDYFFQRNRSKTYVDFEKLREHVFNWIPMYQYQLRDKKRSGENKNGTHEKLQQNSGGSKGSKTNTTIGRELEFDKP